MHKANESWVSGPDPVFIRFVHCTLILSDRKYGRIQNWATATRLFPNYIGITCLKSNEHTGSHKANF